MPCGGAAKSDRLIGIDDKRERQRLRQRDRERHSMILMLSIRIEDNVTHQTFHHVRSDTRTFLLQGTLHETIFIRDYQKKIKIRSTFPIFGRLRRYAINATLQTGIASWWEPPGTRGSEKSWMSPMV